MAPHLSPSKRSVIKELHDQGQTHQQIAEHFNCAPTTITNVLCRMAQHSDPYYVTPGRGCPKKISDSDVLYACQQFKGGFWMDAADAQRKHYTETGASTWQQELALHGLHGQVVRVKPDLKP